MAHKHSVYDTDAHFRIDPITRAIKNETPKKITLIQFDHNSERFSFDMPRYIDGHDMMMCNLVEVHFTNTDTKTGEANSDFYEVKDMQISPDDEEKVVFSWLIDERATQYAGSLEFLIKFKCMTGGVCDYRWNTANNNEISISSGKDNSGTVVEMTPNVVDQWREEIFGNAANAVANINIAEQEALEAVQEEGAAQLEQIQVAGENIVNAAIIAEQNAKNVLANAIKGHLNGEVVTADDVSSVTHEMNVNVKSKNILPYTAKRSSENGTTYVVGEDGSITIDSTPSSGFHLTIGLWKEPVELKGTYTISIGRPLPKGSYFWLKDVEENLQHLITYDSAGSIEKTLTLDGVYKEFGMWISVDGAFSNHVFYPMLEYGEIATEYTPYIDPTTVNATRYGKNLIPFSYTKSNKVNNGVTFDAFSNGAIKMKGTSSDYALFFINSTNIEFQNEVSYDLVQPNTAKVRLIMNYLNENGVSEWIGSTIVWKDSYTFKSLYIQIDPNVIVDEVYVPVIKRTDEPIERYTPSSDGTVSGMMSTAPNMTILTDTEGVVIDCEYIVDTKTYIDKKFEELKNAILSEE